MFRTILGIEDLPVELVEQYRGKGWTDEEILDNLRDAINFMESHLRCDEIEEEMRLDSMFSNPLVGPSTGETP